MFFVLLFMCIGLSRQDGSIQIKELKKPLKFFTNFLEHFRHFHVVFHADTSQTIRFVDKMLQYTNGKGTTYNIYNYEVYHQKYIRPNASHILNVLLCETDEIFRKINSYKIIKYTDVVVHVFWKASSLTHTSSLLRLTGNMMAVHLTDKIQKIYRACYYCGTRAQKYQLIHETNTSKLNLTLNMEKLLQLDDFKNLNQHKLRVIYMQYYPFVYCQETLENMLCSNLGGVESHFLQTMSEKLNFSYTIHTLNSSATFFHMIQRIHNFNYDFGVGGISITKDRMPLIQYTMQYNSEDYVFLYLLKLRFREIFKKFIEPFRSYVVWILYMFSYVLFCGILYVYNVIHNTFPNLCILDVFWMLFHQPLEQSFHKSHYFSSRTRYSAMIALAAWWSLTLIMVTIYKSSVLSSLVHPPNTEPDNFEDLVNGDFCIAGNINYEDIIHEMLNINDPLYQKGLLSTVYYPGPCAALEKILDGNCAMLDELSEIMFELRTICPQIKRFEEFRVTRKAIRSTGHAWALQNGAPFIEAFDYYISLILSGGLFQKWVANETNKARRILFHRSREIRERETRALSFQRFQPILLVLCVGYIVAVVSFVFEVVFYYFYHK